MAISITRKADIVADVPARWARQYARVEPHDWKAQVTTKLLALKAPFTAEEVNSIIGNDSWTANECTECGQDHDVLVHIGDEPDYDARWVDLCGSCLAKALAKAEGR